MAPATIESRARMLLNAGGLQQHRPRDGDHLTLAIAIVKLQDQVQELSRPKTATEEHFQKLSPPAAGHTAPDDAEIAELYTLIRSLSSQLSVAETQSRAQESLTREYAAEIDRLKQVNHVLIEAHHKELSALGSRSPDVLIDACENLFRECPTALILAAEGVSVLATLQSAMKLAKARAAAVEK